MSSGEYLQRAGEITRRVPREQLIRVVLADGYPMVRYGLRQLLTSERDFEVVGEASNVRDVSRVLNHTRPDILIIDVRMVGVSKLRSLRKAGIKAKVVVLATSEDKNEILKAVTAGSSGVIMKDAAAEIIVEVVRRVHAGQVVDLVTMATGMDHSSREAIATKRERQVIALLAKGYTDREIANKLLISPQTVKNHLHSVYKKYGVSGRLELMLHVLYKGLHVLDRSQQQH